MSKTYGNVIQIIKSLYYTDTGIIDYFKDKQAGKIPNRNIITYYNNFSVEILASDIDLTEWMNNIHYSIWRNVDLHNFKCNLLFEYCNSNECVPAFSTVYKNHNLGYFLDALKQKIIDSNDDMYLKLSENQYLKESIDKHIQLKIKKKNIIPLDWSEWHDLLTEYCNDNKCCPISLLIYKGQKLGRWYHACKSKINDVNQELYINLSKNKYVKENLDDYLKYKEQKPIPEKKIKLNWDEWFDIVIEYCNINKCCLGERIKYKNYNIGTWFRNQKIKIDNISHELYIKFSTNTYLKNNVDLYLNNREINKDKIPYTLSEQYNLLYEFCNNYKRYPKSKEIYKTFAIGSFLYREKIKIKNKDDEMYIKLTINPHVKIHIDKYLKKYRQDIINL